MSKQPIPVPTGRDLTRWATQVVSYLRGLESEIDTPGPKVIQLEHMMEGAKATSDGLLMFDPVSQLPHYATEGTWRSLVGNSALNGYVEKSGDTMTGPLTISGTDAVGNALKISNGYPGIWFNDTTPAAAPASADMAMTAGNGWFRFGNADADGVMTDIFCSISPISSALLVLDQRVVGGSGNTYAITCYSKKGQANYPLRLIDEDGYERIGLYATAGNDVVLRNRNGSSSTVSYLQLNANGAALISAPGGTSFNSGPVTINGVFSGGNAGLKIVASYPSIHFQDNGSTKPDLFMSAANDAFRVGQTDAGSVTYTSWATCSSAAGWVAGSDERLKHDITPYEDDALALVNQLQPVSFIWNDTDRADFGLIAQKVREVLPAAVVELPVNEEGDDPMLGLHDRPLVALLIKAVQQLTLRVQELEAR